MARSCAIVWALALSLIVAAPVQAQWLPSNLGIDSSFRAGYLFAWQMFQIKQGTEIDTFKYQSGLYSYPFFRTQFAPRIPVLSADIEWTPIPIPGISGRLGGAISVLETDIPYQHAMDDSATNTEWDVAPDYKQWEAAGLVHLWTGGGYRFSLLAGFRQEYWLYAGNPAGSQSDTSFLRDKINSSIPFIGAQTAMFFPWWKARFELLGSPFMSKRIDSHILNDFNTVRYNGTADSGAMFEFTVEGTAAVTSRCRLGLYGRYLHQEVGGQMEKITGNATSNHKLNFVEQMLIICANLTVLF